MEAGTYQEKIGSFSRFAREQPYNGMLPAWAKEDSPALRLLTMSLGLAGEAGEVADLVKKHFGHGHPLDFEKLRLELSDVAFYLADLCSAVGLNLSDVLLANVNKLTERYPRGFTAEASLNRTK